REISDVSASLALDGEIVSSFYRLMSKAQADQASKEGKEKYSEWQGNLKGVNAEGEAAQGDPAERAAVADIFGRIDDLRCKYEEEQAKLAEETDQKEKKDERKKTVDKKVLEDVAQGKGDAHEWEAGVKGTGSGKAKPVEKVTLKDAKKKLAQTYRSALCLSGGGIRSAIFNLGILQGLARHGLLENFDYLSSVSGGGF